MSNLNRVTLIGRAGNTPEKRATSTGSEVSNFSIATTEKYKNKAGGKEESTEWHNAVAWNKICDYVTKYINKGDLVYIEGALKYSKYTNKEGIEKSKTEILCSSVKLLSSSKKIENGEVRLPEFLEESFPF